MRNEKNQSVFGSTVFNAHSEQKMGGVEKSACSMCSIGFRYISQEKNKV